MNGDTPRILGPDGRPLRKEALTREIAAPSLTGIRQVWSGSVASGLTPQRLAGVLRAATEGDPDQYLILAGEMKRRDPHLASVLRTRKLAVLGREIVVEAATDAPRDVEIADAVREQLVRAPQFRPLIRDLLDGIWMGYSVVEINWDTHRTPWAPRDRHTEQGDRIGAYQHRDQRFFRYDRETWTHLRLIDEAEPIDGIPLGRFPYRFIAHEPKDDSGNPALCGLAFVAAVGYMCKTFSLMDWMAFADVFGMPVRLGRYSGEPKQGDLDKLVAAVMNLGSDAAAVLHESMTIEFPTVNTPTGGPDMFKNLAEYLDKQLSKLILGQTASAEGTPGKLGNEDAQSEVREDILKSDAGQVSDTLNRDLVKPFVDLNFGPQEQYPRLFIHVPDAEDLALLVTALEKLVPLGLKVEQSVIRDKLGLPDPEEGGELLQIPPASPPPFDKGGLGGISNRALNRARAASDDALDALAEEALADWRPQIEPILDPVQRLANRAASYDEFIAGLPALLETMDPNALIHALATAAFKARGVGDATDAID